jgi:hypothetical protein
LSAIRDHAADFPQCFPEPHGSRFEIEQRAAAIGHLHPRYRHILQQGEELVVIHGFNLGGLGFDRRFDDGRFDGWLLVPKQSAGADDEDGQYCSPRALGGFDAAARGAASRAMNQASPTDHEQRYRASLGLLANVIR